jgi:hypothetical protein
LTVPGVNLISAAAFIAAIGNPNRFLTSRKLVAYLGLDPKVRQSDEGPAGAPKYTRRATGRWASNQLTREAERDVAAQAETSYQRMVQDQLVSRPPRRVGASVTPERALPSHSVEDSHAAGPAPTPAL